MSIIKTFMQTIRGKTKTENVRTSDYVIGDFPFATPDAISAESAMRIICCLYYVQQAGATRR